VVRPGELKVVVNQCGEMVSQHRADRHTLRLCLRYRGCDPIAVHGRPGEDGAYHYGDLLGVKPGHVPVIIPLAWFMMTYPSWMVARALIRGINSPSIPGLTAQAVVGAMVMTAWDVVMDPGMTAAGNWIWKNSGAYFGVPRQNYLGWLLTTFLVYWIVGWLWRDTNHRTSTTRTFEALPVIVYSFFAVRYVTAGSFPALQLIAIFSMGMPALLALMQVCMNNEQHRG
jgi:uncharacterized membrane protein